MSHNPTREQTRSRTAAAAIPDSPDIPLDEYQAAKFLGCSVHKLRRDRWKGNGAPFLKIGNLIRYDLPELRRLKESCRRISTSDASCRAAAGV